MKKITYIKFFELNEGRHGNHKGLYYCPHCKEYDTFTGNICDGCGKFSS